MAHANETTDAVGDYVEHRDPKLSRSECQERAYTTQLTKKAAASRSFPINLHQFFPPNDEFATCIVRLLVLRDDLSLELNGITLGPYEWLDKNGTPWRHNYFFRNSVRTLREIGKAIHRLSLLPEFQLASEKHWSAEDQQNFKDFCKELEKARELVKGIRDIIGGHVLHKAVARALQLLGSDSTGFWEYPHHPSDRPRHTHHPF
jgi:hypothetical protein